MVKIPILTGMDPHPGMLMDNKLYVFRAKWPQGLWAAVTTPISVFPSAASENYQNFRQIWEFEASPQGRLLIGRG